MIEAGTHSLEEMINFIESATKEPQTGLVLGLVMNVNRLYFPQNLVDALNI